MVQFCNKSVFQMVSGMTEDGKECKIDIPIPHTILKGGLVLKYICFSDRFMIRKVYTSKTHLTELQL